MRILLTGGGSGGHAYPLLAVADALRKSAIQENVQLELRYLGPLDEWSAVLKDAGVEMSSLISGKIRRYFSLLNLLDIPKFFIGIIQSFFKVFWHMPDAIFSKGGSGAFLVVFAGWFYRIPVLIHESDAAPGLANLVSAPFATRIAVSFENAAHYFNAKKVAVVGNPIRSSLLKIKTDQAVAKRELGFDPGRPLIFIEGGSQGSRRINEFTLLALKDLIQAAQILHQTGTSNYADVSKLARTALVAVPLKIEAESRYKPVAFLGAEHMALALSAADLVVARSGSGNIFEIAAFGKPSILIPLRESANDHQKANAYAFAKTGAAAVIEEENLLPGIFMGQVKAIFGNASLLLKMSAASAAFGKPGAAEAIADELLRIGEK